MHRFLPLLPYLETIWSSPAPTRFFVPCPRIQFCHSPGVRPSKNWNADFIIWYFYFQFSVLVRWENHWCSYSFLPQFFMLIFRWVWFHVFSGDLLERMIRDCFCLSGFVFLPGYRFCRNRFSTLWDTLQALWFRENQLLGHQLLKTYVAAHRPWDVCGWRRTKWSPDCKIHFLGPSSKLLECPTATSTCSADNLQNKGISCLLSYSKQFNLNLKYNFLKDLRDRRFQSFLFIWLKM